jgi:hypothetical protein
MPDLVSIDIRLACFRLAWIFFLFNYKLPVIENRIAFINKNIYNVSLIEDLPDSESLESLESLLSESIELLLLALSRRPVPAAC